MAPATQQQLVAALEDLKRGLTAYATGGSMDSADYVRLRGLVLSAPALAARLPPFVRRCRTTSDFWGYIKQEIPGYQPRRDFLATAFNPLLDDLESGRLIQPGCVSLQADIVSEDPVTHEFIHAQIAKCEAKLSTADYDGAITNARALLEAVLHEMERRLDPNPRPAEGDLIKQYKRVQKLLKLDPASQNAGTSLQQVLTGLVSVVTGMAGLRNALSDAHVRSHRPGAHHARLVVNTAKTLADFLFDTFEYQAERQRRTSAAAPGGPR